MKVVYNNYMATYGSMNSRMDEVTLIYNSLWKIWNDILGPFLNKLPCMMTFWLWILNWRFIRRKCNSYPVKQICLEKNLIHVLCGKNNKWRKTSRIHWEEGFPPAWRHKHTEIIDKSRKRFVKQLTSKFKRTSVSLSI